VSLLYQFCLYKIISQLTTWSSCCDTEYHDHMLVPSVADISTALEACIDVTLVVLVAGNRELWIQRSSCFWCVVHQKLPWFANCFGVIGYDTIVSLYEIETIGHYCVIAMSARLPASTRKYLTSDSQHKLSAVASTVWTVAGKYDSAVVPRT
jgi:hypothetical protein